MYIRKLVKAGIASYTVALPKDWINENALNKGDMIYVKKISKNELLISTELKEGKKEEKEITINLDNRPLDTIHRELTSAYVNNYNTIIILGKELYKNVVKIRNILNDFIGLEITEQTTTKLVAKDMLDLKEVSIHKTIRRMDNIVRSIIKDLINPSKDMIESVNYRDFDVNRLYFLSFKIVKISLSDPEIAKLIGIDQYKDILSIWYLILNLESVADNLKDIYLPLISLVNESYFKELIALIKSIESNYLDVLKSYYNKDKNLADKVASTRKDIFNRCLDLSEKYKNITLTKILENLKEIKNHICNISRIVMDKD